MLQIGEVLSVLDDDAGILATPLVLIDEPVVPLIFAAPEIKKGSCHTSEAGTHALRLCNRERFGCGVIRPAGKVMRRGRLAEQAIHGERRRDVFIRPAERGDVRQVIGQMLRVYRHDAVDRCGDPVNAEDLIVCRIVRLRLDQALSSYELIILAGGRVFHHELKCAVSLFRNLA